jgi:hypothetical protein
MKLQRDSKSKSNGSRRGQHRHRRGQHRRRMGQHRHRNNDGTTATVLPVLPHLVATAALGLLKIVGEGPLVLRTLLPGFVQGKGILGVTVLLCLWHRLHRPPPVLVFEELFCHCHSRPRCLGGPAG